MPGVDQESIQEILEQRVAERRTVGIVVATVDSAGVVRSFAAGSTGAVGLPLDRKTVFEIGSITKAFTTALLAEMVSTGEVALDAPAQDYLPAVRMPERGGRQITLLDLATHSSGLPRLPTNFRPGSMANPYADYTVQQLYQFLSSYSLERDIGVQYEYSNVGFGVLGHVLALRGGASYETLLSERILRPLGMTETSITLSPDLIGRLAVGHDANGLPVATWDFPALAGTGALRSTVDDVVKFLFANLDPEKGPLGPILATTHLSRRPVVAGQTIGLAWHILAAPGGPLVWHNGGTGGYRSFLGFYPSTRTGVVLLTNSAIDPDDIGFHLLDSALSLTQGPVERHEVAVDPMVLAGYPGVYQLGATAFLVAVTLEDGQLMAEASGQPKVRLCPESDTTFFIREADVQARFVKGAAGEVTGLIVIRSGQEIATSKVK